MKVLSSITYICALHDTCLSRNSILGRRNRVSGFYVCIYIWFFEEHIYFTVTWDFSKKVKWSRSRRFSQTKKGKAASRIEPTSLHKWASSSGAYPLFYLVFLVNSICSTQISFTQCCLCFLCFSKVSVREERVLFLTIQSRVLLFWNP